MKIVTIVGARPQFIKAAPISRALRDAGHDEYMVHTGQHYDHAMSQVFFDELAIPAPHENLAVGSGLHGQQTGLMLARIEAILLRERPDWVMVFGDTNSTLAGALAAAKLGIRCGHIEAGLRSFRRSMPEEINRIVSDHCADLLFAPTTGAMEMLVKEGLKDRAVLVGDVMYDAVLMFAARAEQTILISELGLTRHGFFLSTLHRADTTDNSEKLREVVTALDDLSSEVCPVIVPMHPRTRQAIGQHGIQIRNLKVIQPLSYLNLLGLLRQCRAVLTDSGGLQKEAYFARKLCLTLREETEWTETVDSRANVLCGTQRDRILSHGRRVDELEAAARFDGKFYGDGNAAKRIVERLA